MSDIKLKEPAPVLDSETSLDYYVTTVSDQTPKKSVEETSKNSNKELGAIVVSVDRAGSVKVRKRKKSKRRKKKSNLALEEIAKRASDDGILFQSSGSDGSQNKVPRRSASLCEKDLRKTSKVLFTDIISQDKPLNGNLPHDNRLINEDVVVRRRVKKKSSFQSNRQRTIVDNSPTVLTPKTTLPTSSSDTFLSQHNAMNYQSSQLSLSSNLTTGVNSHEPVKKLNRQDALATLNAFMVEVQEATTVAKQQEQQEEERKKEPSLRRSHSLSELPAEDTDVSSFDPNDSVPALPEPRARTSSKPPLCSHQKSESFGQHSIVSGSVFMSDHDASVDDPTITPGLHPPLVKTSSEETTGRGKRSQSLFDIVLDGEDNILTDMMSRKVSRNQSTICRTQTHSQKPKDFDYGIAHLEQVCKLIEQIGDLRNQNTALIKRVHQLEKQVKELKEGKGNSNTESPSTDTYQTLPKKSHPVGRLKDAISRSTSRSRKSSFEKTPPPHEQKGMTHSITVADGLHMPFASSTASSGFGELPQERPTIHSNVQLKKHKRPAYSRDDLDLSSKDRWKFWKAPSKSIDPNQPSRKRVVSSIRSENAQGSATHLKSASVTLDSLLSNIDNDFSQKMLQWQSSARPSRAPSRASDVSISLPNRASQSSLVLPSSDDSLRFKVHRLTPDGKAETPHKESLRQKLSKWEKVAAKKFSLDKRSKSVDRMNALKDTAIESNLGHHTRTLSAAADFHKSMPCVMTASTESRLKQLKRRSVNDSVASVEWSGLQEAFPTNSHSNGKPLSRLLGSTHSRLASPLRKKNSQAHKRRSWSFGKRPSSKYYLPNAGDFSLGSNLELAESMGDQFTLELDHDDVKGISTSGVNDEELNHLKKNTADLRDKLSEIESIYKEPKKSKVPQRPASSLARYHTEPNALSFRRSKHVEILRLCSCEILSSPMSMSPLYEEIESPLMYHSLPDLRPDGIREEDMRPRRYTVTVIDRQPSDPKVLGFEPASMLDILDNSDFFSVSTTPRTSSFSKGGRGSVNPEELRKRWDSERLQQSRSNRSNFNYDSSFVRPRAYTDASAVQRPKLKKKRSTLSMRVMDRLHKKSPKSRRSALSDGRAAQPSFSLSPKKKGSGIFSLKDKTNSELTSYSTDNNASNKSQKESPKLSKLDKKQNSVTAEKENPDLAAQEQDKHEKLTQMSKRLSGPRPRRESSPPLMTKGIVSRLSKRFARQDKEVKTAKSTKPVQAKNTDFLIAKNHFESRSNSLPAASRQSVAYEK